MRADNFPIFIVLAIAILIITRIVGALGKGAGAQARSSISAARLRLPPPAARAGVPTAIGVRTDSASREETSMNPISFAIFLAFLGLAAAIIAFQGPLALAVALGVLGLLVLFSLKMAQQWQKAVILRAGKLQGIKGPGLFFIVPVLDSIIAWIDQRIRTSEFSAEQALTRDTVPVNVDAIVFWMVHDAERAALEIADYNSAVQRVAQTSLREMIGSSLLSDLLSERKEADATLKAVIGAKTAEWGVTVNSVEIRDVAIPDNLQDAMSRQAQAEREKQARVTLGSAEEQVAQSFVNAARLYAQSPEALQLRAMNIVYETTKERGATILMPTTMVDAMNPGVALALLNRLPSRPEPAPPPATQQPNSTQASS